ncbi:MAG: NAD(P)/FAD-dependent oxidoreductase [Puniceicoccaceae bacterium]
MKKVLILGAGTAGTIMANTLSRKAGKDWAITIIDQSEEHYYQPGFLFMPFGVYTEKDVVKPRKKFLPGRAVYRQAKLDRIIPEENKVLLEGGEEEAYDILIIGTGCDIAPDEIEGLTGADWGKRSHDFYTFEGARRLAAAMKDWQGGRLVINIAEMPIKCPVAPLEFAFLADWHLTERGLRDKTEIVYVTPLSGAFTKPIASAILSHLLEEKNIKVEQDFAIGSVDNEGHKIVSWDEREIGYDLLVSVPTNMGNPLIDRSGLGDELNFVPTNRDTLQAKAAENIFVLGDATDLPTSKAGSVAHFQAEVLTANILSYMKGEEMEERFDGHANCFIESGYGKGFLLDFNYDQEPVPGHFPFPHVGPFGLLSETRINHLGKLAFKYVYWHMLLKGYPIPFVDHRMSYLGKKVPKASA